MLSFSSRLVEVVVILVYVRVVVEAGVKA